MSAKLKPYPKYKDSGIEWLGEVPEGWLCLKLKHYGTYKSGDLIQSEDIKGEGKYPIIGGNGVRGYTNSYNLCGMYPVIGRQGALCGNVNFSKEKSWVTEHGIIVRNYNKITSSKWLGYMLSAMNLNQYSMSSAQPGLAVENIVNLESTLPSLQEQTTIANYLDQQTAKIDQLIENYQKLIVLSKEKRTALITHCVTKGLDPTVKIKDSGIEWLGEVAEEWRVVRVKNKATLKARIGWQNLRTEEFMEEGPYCVTGTDFIDGKINWKSAYHVSEERYEMDKNIQLSNGDLLVTKDGTIGKLAIVKNLIDTKATLNSGVFILRPQLLSLNIKYMYWVMSSSIFTNFVNYISNGSTINHLYQADFYNMYFGLPSFKEQTTIANYLDKQTAKLDQTIEKAEKAIELLKEKRTALITAVVTGKVDVRGVSDVS